MLNRRIALISDHASPLAVAGGVDSGGQNVYVAQVARHLAARGCAVDVFTRRDAAEPAEVVDWQPGVRVVHVPAGPPRFVRKEELLPFMGDFAGWMADFCRRQGMGYDLVHANFFMSGMVAIRLQQRLGLPFVMTFHALGKVRRLHQGDADGFPEARLAIEERIIGCADRIIAECPQDEQDLVRLYGADPASITVIPCGFDPAEFAPVEKSLARRTLDLPADDPIVLQLGRLVPRKGIDTVIRGVAELRRRHGIPARLIVVGGDSDAPDENRTPEIRRLRAVADAAKIAEHVQFTGRRDRDRLRFFYSAADVFVTTPWYEPFGITPLEAMACGTPVVGANVGGIKHSVQHGKTGFLVPPRDPGAVADRLVELYRDPPLLARLGRNGLKRAHEHFTWQRVAGAIAALYEDVLTDRKMAPARRAYAGSAPVAAFPRPAIL